MADDSPMNTTAIDAEISPTTSKHGDFDWLFSLKTPEEDNHAREYQSYGIPMENFTPSIEEGVKVGHRGYMWPNCEQEFSEHPSLDFSQVGTIGTPIVDNTNITFEEDTDESESSTNSPLDEIVIDPAPTMKEVVVKKSFEEDEAESSANGGGIGPTSRLDDVQTNDDRGNQKGSYEPILQPEPDTEMCHSCFQMRPQAQLEHPTTRLQHSWLRCCTSCLSAPANDRMKIRYHAWQRHNKYLESTGQRICWRCVRVKPLRDFKESGPRLLAWCLACGISNLPSAARESSCAESKTSCDQMDWKPQGNTIIRRADRGLGLTTAEIVRQTEEHEAPKQKAAFLDEISTGNSPTTMTLRGGRGVPITNGRGTKTSRSDRPLRSPQNQRPSPSPSSYDCYDDASLFAASTWAMTSPTAHVRSRHRGEGLWGNPGAARAFESLADWEVWLADKYFQGVPIAALSPRLDFPIAELLPHARLCLVLFCEHESAAFRAVARDRARYARFVADFDPDPRKPDGECAREVRAAFPWLDAMLKEPGYRWRLLGAFRSVDLSTPEEDNGAEALPEPAVGGKEGVDVEMGACRGRG